jgi:hypothetical protein
MANHDIAPATTGTTLNTQDAASLRKLWHKGALIGEEEEDFFQQFEGPSERSPIWTNNDMSKGNGMTMTFTTTSGYYGEGKYGEGLFEGPDDYEQDDINSFPLNVDFVRNASSRSVRADEVMGLRDELTNMVPVKLGKWLGRTKRDNMMGLCVLTLPSENRIYAGGKTLATLASADVLSWDDIVTTGAAMKPLGGLPANISKDGRNEIWSQNFIPSETAALSLRLDSDYKTVLQNGDVRGRGNTMFKGGYPSIDGHTIIPHNALNHAGKGAVGSFLAPEAFLGAEITGTTDAARDLSGGGTDNSDGSLTGSGKPLWFKYFPGHDFQFVDTGILDVSASSIGDVAGPHYAIIYNTTGANAGKWGFVKYTTGNNGNKITITEFLTGQAGGTYRKGTVGSVTWDSGKNTEVWASGALIIPANAKGVPFGHTIALGRGGICRGYGMWRAHRSTEVDNGGFIKRVYIASVFGQALRRDRKDRVPAAMLLTHAISRPGINLPTVS